MNIGLGILIALIAGALNGMFALPMKLNKNWAWENNWFPFSFFSLMIFPLVIVILSIPKPIELLSSLPIHNILMGLFFGIIIYGGSLLFGISLGFIGIALSFTLLVGSMSIVGVLLPLIIFNSNILFLTGGIFIFSGVLFFLISLFFSFKAGQFKEASLKNRDIENTGKKLSMKKGMILAIAGGGVSGLLSLVMNMGWAKEIVDKAVQTGNANLSYASNAVLFILLIGGLIPNIGYCIFLLNKNKNWNLYKKNNFILYWIAILLMGLLYSASIGLWGISISESMLGNLGPSVGWALFIGMMVISSNISGYLTGEWKSADNKTLKYFFVSIGLIISALLLIGYGNYTLNNKNTSKSQPVTLEKILLLSKSKLAGGEILLMNSSHQDLAWMDFLEKCIVERDTMLMTPLLKAASKDPGYRFDIEDVLIIKEYIGRFPDAKVEIIRMLKDGRLSCGSTYQMPYEEMYSGESLVRQFYLGARWVKENLDGYFPDTYWNPDVPGRTMQMAQIMSKSGTKNMVMSRHEKGVFRWYSPDGSFVYAYSPGHYGADAEYLKKEFPESSDILAQKSLFWDKRYNTKIDVQPVVPVLSDWDMSPAMDYSQLISKWNNLGNSVDEKGERKTITLPKIRLATAPEFIERIVRSSPDLKKITGERPAVWLYIHGPSHEWALKASREGDIMMTNAEKFSTIDALLHGTFRNYPEERLKRAWESKIYPDHGWGGKGGESTDAIFLNKFERSLDEAKSITNEALKSIASKIRTNPRKGIPVIVFNSLSWKREDPVSFKISFDPGKTMDIMLTDAAGEDIPVQLSDIERYKDNSLKRVNAIFVAREIPSIGYKTYYVVPQITILTTKFDNQDKIETPFYKIELGNGGVKSIFDKELSIELLNTRELLGGDVFTMRSVGTGAGEFADIQQPDMEGFDKVSDHPAKWDVVERGAVYTTYKFRQPIRDSVVETRLVVYHDIKKIDFETSLLNWKGVLYREYRFALPINMKDGRVSYEVPFGVVEVGKDEIAGAAGEIYLTTCSDIHPRGVENWIGASDERFGVTLSTSTAVADYIDPAGLSSGALLLQPIMLASRRSCHSLGNEYLQTGNHYFHFSLTSHKPGYENGYKFGRQSNEKLLVVVDPQAGKSSPLPEEISFFSVDASNVSVSTIKKTENDNDVVIRLFETGMGETLFHLNSWFNIVKAEKTNLLEYEGKVIESRSNIVPVNLGSHAIETIKLVIN